MNIDERISNWILEKYTMKVENELNLFRTGANDRLL
jgi:hypothetical protein